jgi:protein phosphatase
MLTSFAKTHIGQRTTNEDFILVNKKIGLYIVADGVGELGKGDVASKVACKKVLKCIKQRNNLNYSVYQAHGALVDLIESNSKKQGMATTIAAVLFKGNEYDISWVGDSRVYLWDGKLKLLTKDDSHVEVYLEKGLISYEDMVTHPDRNYITQALGMRRKEITIHSNSGTLEQNQVLLICSDGLYTKAKEVDIINQLRLQKDMTHLTETLVNMAVERGGIDNISLISVISDESTNEQEESTKPDIVREFEANTGNVKNSIHETDHQETDLDLVDITKLQELTQLERDLLESAAHRAPKIEEKTNYKLPIAVFVITVLVGTLLYFLL